MNSLGKKVMAYRYLYYCKGISLISDREYDFLEKKALEDPVNDALNYPGSDLPESYSDEIKTIANKL